MKELRQMLFLVVSLGLWVLAVFVFLIGVPLLAHEGLSTGSALAGVALYTLLALALAFGGFRMFKASHDHPTAA